MFVSFSLGICPSNTQASRICLVSLVSWFFWFLSFFELSQLNKQDKPNKQELLRFRTRALCIHV